MEDEIPNRLIQIRFENGEIIFKDTIAEAMKLADADIDVWKISWTDKETGERIRLVRYNTMSGDKWMYEPIVLPESTERL